ncbi:MAG: carbon monoxide dehydrogenase, partial [Desulfosporosinus sp.]|nr:carbon monoxide dehydrogenase [Desulfosporosinus sp.]
INKVHPGQIEDIQREMNFIPILGYLPYDAMAVQADLTGQSLFDLSPKFVELAKEIKIQIEALLG